MKYVINIDKQIDVNTYNSQFIKMTKNENEFKHNVKTLENSFKAIEVYKRTIIRSDGEFTFADIELKRG